MDLYDRGVIVQKLRNAAERKADELRDVCRSLANHPVGRSSVETLRDHSWIEVAAETYLELARRATIAGAQACAAELAKAATLIFRRTQGVLLDETFGFAPHITWSNTTDANARAILAEVNPLIQMQTIGVLRTYFTRHGAGPFVTEDSTLRPLLDEPHNNDDGWQETFRVGVFDAVAARYALECVGVDGLAITHLDRLPNLPPKICTAYQRDGANGEFDCVGSASADAESKPRLSGTASAKELGDFPRSPVIGGAGSVRGRPALGKNRPLTPALSPDYRGEGAADPSRFDKFPASKANPTGEERTRRIEQYRPVFSPIDTNSEERFLDALARELKTPVVLTSDRPAGDMTWLTSEVSSRLRR